MLSNSKRSEIDHRKIKLLIGLIAITLANLTAFFSGTELESISASYHEGGWARDIFVGFLFAISAFLLAYNGKSNTEMLLSKTAAIAGLGVAMFPCKCGDHKEIIANVHGISAAIMFLILAIFCYIFFKRARAKGHPEAMRRSYIYAICGLAIVGSIAILIIDNLMGGDIKAKIPRLTFYAERVGLVAFGIAWLVASRVLPFIASSAERTKLVAAMARQQAPTSDR